MLQSKKRELNVENAISQQKKKKKNYLAFLVTKIFSASSKCFMLQPEDWLRNEENPQIKVVG